MCFCLLYRLYLTKLGKNYHKKQIQKAHAKGVYEKRKHDCGVFEFGDIKIHVIPFLDDNYAYIIEKPQESQYSSQPVVLVDPADFEAVEARLVQLNLKPTMILTTHKHWDHAGGNLDFLHKYNDIKVSGSWINFVQIYGSATDKPEATTHSLRDGDTIPFGEKLTFEAIYTGGHTRGHMIYKLVFEGNEIIFSGDFIFQGFCGKHFESNPKVMSSALLDLRNNKISEEAVIFPGHNYGEKNLRFAVRIDPENIAIQNMLEKIVSQAHQRETNKEEEKFSQNLCPVPLSMKEEIEYNLTLRVDQEYLQKKLGKSTVADTFKELRNRKDKFDNEWEKEQKRKEKQN